MLQNIQTIRYGDTIKFLSQSNETLYELKIAGIVDNFEPYFDDESNIKVMLSKERLRTEKAELEATGLGFMSDGYEIEIDTDKPDIIEEKVNKLKLQENFEYLYGHKISDSMNTVKMEELSRRAITKIPLYTVVVFIVLLSIVNIFNTIYSSIILN